MTREILLLVDALSREKNVPLPSPGMPAWNELKWSSSMERVIAASHAVQLKMGSGWKGSGSKPPPWRSSSLVAGFVRETSSNQMPPVEEPSSR